MEEKLKKLEKKLGISFKDENTLKNALTHRSYVVENSEVKISNERLEFLGDAVLELAVSKFLYDNYPDQDEGRMTTIRSMLVNTKRLAQITKEIGIPEYILMSKGELKTSGQEKESILADTFEAIIGAIYIDRGFKKAYEFIKKNLLTIVDKVIKEESISNPKGLFQEIAQEKSGITPNYKVLETWGPDHDKNFIAGVYLNDELIAKGQGKSKQEAESVAAKEALKIKKWK